jgi:hypothetical protein
MADKLAVWNQALVHLEVHALTSLTDDAEARYVFDQAWDGVVEEAFDDGDWNFAKATVALSESSSGTAALGWTYVFDYPSDHQRTIALSDRTPFNLDDQFWDYLDEGGYIHADTPTLYMRYISNAKQATAEISTWPTFFWRYVAMKLAYEACGKITGGQTDKEMLEKRLMKALRKAKSVDARNEPNKRVPTGTWIKARRGGYGRGRDGGTLVGGEITLGEGDV